MQTASSFFTAFAYVSSSDELLLFLASMVLLLAGLLALVWRDARNLRFLDKESLKSIEMKHPHLPSPRAIMVMALSLMTLFFVSLRTVNGVPPFNDPYHGLNIATLFVIATTCGVLAELRWRSARSAAFAFIAGTATAFIIIAAPSDPLLSLLSGLAVLLAWAGLLRDWNLRVFLIGCISFLAWFALFSASR